MTEEPDPQDDAVSALLEDDHLEVDLGDPPTRSDLAVPDGRRTFIIESPERDLFRTTVTFSDGHVLDVDQVSFVSVETDGTSDPTRLVVGVRDLGPEEMAELLRADVDRFGLDPARVDAFLDAMAGAEAGDRFTRRAIPAEAIAPPEWMEVQPVVRGESGRYVVNYTVDWKG